MALMCFRRCKNTHFILNRQIFRTLFVKLVKSEELKINYYILPLYRQNNIIYLIFKLFTRARLMKNTDSV